MASTRRDLIDAVLDNLGVLVFGQAPSADMVQRVDDHINPGLAQLATLGLLSVSDPGTPNPATGGTFEDESFLPLADWMSFAVAAPFGLGADPALKVLADEAEAMLRRIARPPRTRKMLTTDPILRMGNRRVPFNYITGR
jgi:hypothetical protein